MKVDGEDNNDQRQLSPQKRKKKVRRNKSIQTGTVSSAADESTDATTQDESTVPKRLSKKKKRAKFDSDLDIDESKNNTGKAESILEETEDDLEELEDVDDISIENEEIYLTTLEGRKISRYQRERLFLRGKRWMEKKEREVSLKCFLTCLSNLDDNDGFDSLADCLHQVATMFAEKGEYEKAVQFVQAEKLFYETALVDTAQLQTEIDRKKSISDPEQKPDENKPDAIRAEEYEHLARLCLEKKQPYLALEYQGKATKLRQQIFGDQHPITIESLDFFTCIYGEVGKQQYSDTLDKVQNTDANNHSNSEDDGEKKEKDIARKRRREINKEKSEQLRREVMRDERNEESTRQEEWISNAILFVLFSISTVVMICAGLYVYCRLVKFSTVCAAINSDLHYAYMRSKYLFYYYTTYRQKNTMVG